MTRLARSVYVLAFAATLSALSVSLSRAAEPATGEGVRLLQKMQQAAKTLDYAGVYTYQQGNVVLSTRVVHIVDGTGERERVALLDGKPREYLRHNDTSRCLLPEQKVVLVERRDSDRFPAILFDDGARLAEHYDVQLADSPERVAGRSCREITLTPRDTQRYGYRFCADQASSLLLRAQTVGPEGVLTQIVFNTLDIGKQVNSEDLNSDWNTKDWDVVELSVHEIDLSSEGWRIPLPPGYQPLTQVMRQMRAGRQVKQLVASDGISTVSVFIEPYTEVKQSRSAGVMRKGAMSVYRTRIGDHWLTVLGEVPPDTVHDLAHRTEYVPLSAQ